MYKILKVYNFDTDKSQKDVLLGISLLTYTLYYYASFDFSTFLTCVVLQ